MSNCGGHLIAVIGFLAGRRDINRTKHIIILDQLACGVLATYVVIAKAAHQFFLGCPPNDGSIGG